MPKLINIGNENLPHLDLFYKDTYILLHQDFIESLINPDESIIDISLNSRFKSELKEIIKDMSQTELLPLEDEFSYDHYIFDISFYAELYMSKELLIPIYFDSTITLLASSEVEARDELEYISKDNKRLLSILDFNNFKNIIVEDDTHREMIDSKDIKRAILKNIKILNINELEIIKNKD